MDDLVDGANISFIRKDRGTRGGGVAVCFDPTKIRMNKFVVPQNGGHSEFVFTLGQSRLTKRKIAVGAVYLPPSIKSRDLKLALEGLIDAIDRIKTKHSDAVFFIGGDFNGKDLEPLLTAFPELKPVGAGATRRGAALDEVYTNMDQCIVDKAILPPLTKIDGTRSDHAIVAASCKLPRANKPVKSTFKFRPITTDGVEQFGRLLAAQDWEKIKGTNASDSASRLEVTLRGMVETCFPEKTRSIKSTDAPWYNEEIRRAVARKMRLYKQEGKSERYIQARKYCEKLVKQAKKKFLGCIIDKVKLAGNTKQYYSAIKLLKTKEAPVVWDIHDMFPSMSDFDICETVAIFFNKISQEYEPLPNPKILEERLDLSLIHI